ncbi:hypothetical protein NC651_006240, partial [Populus alba x Populus x berolinensis]
LGPFLSTSTKPGSEWYFHVLPPLFQISIPFLDLTTRRRRETEVDREMTLFHFFNCAILTFGPHAVYYSATPLSEYDTLGTSVKAALVYLGTALVKLVCLATFLKVSENDSFDPYQELLKALIGFIDVAGLYFALTQLTHRNISQNHKFQAVGLGEFTLSKSYHLNGNILFPSKLS